MAWAPSEDNLGKASPPAFRLWKGRETSTLWHYLQPRLNRTSQKWWEGGEPRVRAPAHPHPSQLRSLPVWMQLHWAILIVSLPYPSPLDASYSLPPRAFRPILCFSWRCFEVDCVPSRVLVSAPPQASAQGREKVQAQMEVQLDLWEHPAGDTASPIHGWWCHTRPAVHGGCTMFTLLQRMVTPMLPPCFQDSRRLRVRGLKSQSLQQIQKRTELLFHS